MHKTEVLSGISSSVGVADSSMELDDQERRWAIQLKQLVESSLDVKNASDMEYAQQAIVAHGDTSLALQRMQGLQRFRDAYQINDTPDQGLYYIREFIRLQPAALLHTDICPLTGEGVLAWDSGSFDPQVALQSSFKSTALVDQNWKVHVCALYYLLQIMAPSFESIREGVFLLLDAVNMTWENISTDACFRLQEELLWYYPFAIKSIMEYNSNSASSIFWGLAKSSMPKKWMSALQVGCQVECSTGCTKPPKTLTELYLQPSQEVANYYTLQRVKQLLETRADNETSFHLLPA